MTSLTVVFLSLCFLAFSGCESKPADVPKTVPCKVVVKNGASPVAGVSVVLGITSGNSSWSVSGTTDSSGVAVMETTHLGWKGSGAPEGEYKITLSKTPTLERISGEEYGKMSAQEQEAYNNEQNKKLAALPREVPEFLGNFEETPLAITVSGADNTLEVDLSTLEKK